MESGWFSRTERRGISPSPLHRIPVGGPSRKMSNPLGCPCKRGSEPSEKIDDPGHRDECEPEQNGRAESHDEGRGAAGQQEQKEGDGHAPPSQGHGRTSQEEGVPQHTNPGLPRDSNLLRRPPETLRRHPPLPGFLHGCIDLVCGPL